MKVVKKLVVVFFILGMILTEVPTGSAWGAEQVPTFLQTSRKVQEVTIDVRKAKMRVGTYLQLHLSGVSGIKAKWTSTNKEVVSVTKWGTMKALKIGKSEVSATYQGKVYRCWVTVLPKELVPVVKLGKYEGVKLTKDSEAPIKTLSDELIDNCTFYNITQKDVNDWKIDYMHAQDAAAHIIAGVDCGTLYEMQGKTKADLAADLDTVKYRLFREELAMLAIAKKEGLMVTAEELDDLIRESLTGFGKKLTETEVAQFKEFFDSEAELCRRFSIYRAIGWVAEHATY